jgi:hypothetical protein
MSEELVKKVAKAIGREMDPEDDIDIYEALINGFDWITKEQAERMLRVAAQAAIAVIQGEHKERQP